MSGKSGTMLSITARSSSTTSFATISVVNGPIRNEIGMNSGIGAMGPYNHANATIGRAVGLILLNTAGAKPGEMDRSTQGTPAKYSFCFGENEEEAQFRFRFLLVVLINAVFITSNWQLAAGREFTDAEMQAGSAVCLIGETVRRTFQLAHAMKAWRATEQGAAHAGIVFVRQHARLCGLTLLLALGGLLFGLCFFNQFPRKG